MKFVLYRDNPWKPEGLFYVARVVYIRNHKEYVITRQLDFISYHVIRFFYGDEALKEMALKV